MFRRCTAVLIVTVAFLVVPSLAFALISPTKVFDPNGSQVAPYRNDTYLLYSSNTKLAPRHWDAFARTLVGGNTSRLNNGGSQGLVGGFDPGTDVVIFQQYSSNGSDINLYNLASQHLILTPHQLQTAAWESDPHISTAYISFFREVKNGGVWYLNLYLYDRVADSMTKLTSIKERNGLFVSNDSLGEHYASWSICAATCKVRLYNADTDTTQTLPSLNGKPQYTSAVDETNGRLYFARSGFGCGLSVSFNRVPLSDLSATPVKMAAIPDGQDVASGASVDAGDLLFSKYPCGGWAGIFALSGAA